MQDAYIMKSTANPLPTNRLQLMKILKNRVQPVAHTKRFLFISSVVLLPLFAVGCGAFGASVGDTDLLISQKGNLAWPVVGDVIEPFGEKVNPLYGTRVYNPGILISSPPSSEVKAVFDGEVMAVYTMPEFGRVVTISHGKYTSLYSNLSLLYVERGMNVSEGQLIGTSGTESEPKGQSVFFAIFDDGAETDPESWLVSR